MSEAMGPIRAASSADITKGELAELEAEVERLTKQLNDAVQEVGSLIHMEKERDLAFAEVERLRAAWAAENVERTNEMMALREAGEGLYDLLDDGEYHRTGGKLDLALVRWREVAGQTDEEFISEQTGGPC